MKADFPWQKVRLLWVAEDRGADRGPEVRTDEGRDRCSCETTQVIGEEIPGAVARQEEAMEAQHENSRQAGCGVPVEVFYSSPQSIDVEKALRQARHRRSRGGAIGTDTKGFSSTRITRSSIVAL